MSITLVEFDNRKPHLRYDAERKKYIGYRVDVRSNGKRLRPTFRTKGEAEQYLAEVKAKPAYTRAGIAARKTQDVRLSKLFDQRVTAIKNEKEKIRAVRVFREFEGLFDSPPMVRDVRKAHFQSYIKKRLDEGVKPATVNREINTLSTPFQNAAEMFPVELEDFEPPPIARPKFKKGKSVKHEITEAEFEKICAAIITDRLPREYPNRTQARPIVADMFRIGWLLGLRFGEVEGLAKKDLTGNSLRVVRTKTGTISKIEPLPSFIVDLLRARIKTSTTDRIFNLPCSRATFENIIKQACETAGLTYGRGVFDGVTFHSTRHSFTSRLVRVADIATAGSFTGHSSAEMVDYYSHASDESKRQAMGRLYGEDRRKQLQDLYDRTVAGNVPFEDFFEALK